MRLKFVKSILKKTTTGTKLEIRTHLKDNAKKERLGKNVGELHENRTSPLSFPLLHYTRKMLKDKYEEKKVQDLLFKENPCCLKKRTYLHWT